MHFYKLAQAMQDMATQEIDPQTTIPVNYFVNPNSTNTDMGFGIGTETIRMPMKPPVKASFDLDPRILSIGLPALAGSILGAGLAQPGKRVALGATGALIGGGGSAIISALLNKKYNANTIS